MKEASDFAVARISALSGAVAWGFMLFVRTADARETELIQKLVLLGVLVVVPLGFLVLSRHDHTVGRTRLFRLLVRIQFLAALALAGSFLLPPGRRAAMLAVPWFGVTALAVVVGIQRLRYPGSLTAAGVAISAGLVYPIVGGWWLIVSRLGMQLFGFGDTIILLTAMHFHYAGFAAPLLLGLAGLRLGTAPLPNYLLHLAVGGLVAGTPLVAAGITYAPVLAFVGALMIAAALWLLAALVMVWVIPPLDRLLPQVLLGVASLSSAFAMVLACLYAYSIVARTVILDIPMMAVTHGIANAVGFALCGLVAWSLIPTQEI
jgi:YndJ-like protein